MLTFHLIKAVTLIDTSVLSVLSFYTRVPLDLLDLLALLVFVDLLYVITSTVK